MIFLFTDFGSEGPYLGQIKSVLKTTTPETPIIDLLSNAPLFNPCASAFLLASLNTQIPDGAIFLCVVDPGVGGQRDPLIFKADNKFFVGPDNGLFSIVMRRAKNKQAWKITWKPENLSKSFHGRDLFAPVVGLLANGREVPRKKISAEVIDRKNWPNDYYKIIYIDHFGNAITGLRAKSLLEKEILEVGEQKFYRAKTFSDVAPGTAFWYENSIGLAEISVNQGRADQLGLKIGTNVTISKNKSKY
ncbi:MAG: SAM-dependent chlorinase/fluorinase [Pseudomonadota bacterium]|nr:SAM-dependent chlorinase/fluorinase [Pseudomonadota bacterium]